ncbi:glucan endo-1,3-beta-glucosidase, basic isoform [Abrus precatorius]|uniref:glucan endo-1,3-beta-D-glucosidase n=1 Tax=Abrus precatorius TaxID=3816 RepID=A0A8B8JE61_ABRPR|nr:glucan endo-1,3-beta-glucosidase, basic isoform [Abrus precatorius]
MLLSSLFTRAQRFSLPALLLLLELFTINLRTADAQIGVCYGMMGNNLPPANEVIDLYRSNNIRRMRLYDPNQGALQALRNSGIELVLGVPNSDLQGLATNADNARQWVQRNVLNFWPSVKIKYIAVGNEVNPVGGSSWLAQYVLPAVQNIYQAIRAQGLHDQIKVSTAIDMTLIGNSYPPSQGSFRNDVRSYIDPIIGYLLYANAPLLVNVYPYFSYTGNPRDISLPYALFTSPNVVVWDGQYGYQNLFDAMLDAVHAAIDNTGIGYVEVVVSESGWPSEGDFAATYDNARVYLDNLIRRAGRGTPRRPSKPTETYLFAMFDENQKNPEIEKHFGLFSPNKQKKYPFGFGGKRNIEVVDDYINATVSLKSDM